MRKLGWNAGGGTEKGGVCLRDGLSVAGFSVDSPTGTRLKAAVDACLEGS